MSLLISCAVLFLCPLLAAMPAEPLWSLAFTSLFAGAALILLLRQGNDKTYSWPTRVVASFAGWALLSLVEHWLVVYHAAPTYLDIMLKGTLFWLACFAAYYTSAVDSSRRAIYLRLIAITAGASCAAGVGVQDYLVHLRYGQGQWREYGTSLPDFFAGHLVMTAPTALALFIGAKGGKAKNLWLLYLFALVLELAAIPTTGSRFAFVSLPIGIAATFGAIGLARARGMEFGQSAKGRIAALAVITLLGGVVVAKPLLLRMQSNTLKSQEHSGDFRVWTWRGTERLIESHPVFGSGPGMFVEAYPKYAIVGYTEHAHNAYLQTAADLGIPGLLALLGVVWLAICASIRSLEDKEQQPIEPDGQRRTKGAPLTPDVGQVAELFEQVFAIDDGYIVCGLIGSVIAALVQNFVDSDWFTFASGVTLFSLLGTMAALCPAHDRHPTVKWIVWTCTAIMAASAIFAAYSVIPVLENSYGNYIGAMRADPLSGKFASDAAIKQYAVQQDATDTEAALRASCSLTPDAVAYHRLGQYYEQTGNYGEAERAWQDGLEYDPHSITLLMALAQLTAQENRPDDSLRYYLRVADLETTPYGTVRAIPEVTETKFVDADAIVGDSYLANRQLEKAIPLYLRARADCEEYFSLGGAANGMRQAMNNMVTDKDLDTHMRALYISISDNLAAAYTEDGDGAMAASAKARLQSELKSFTGS